MASFAYTGAKEKLAKGLLDMTSNMEVALCMTNTTADTDQDATSMSGIGTLDEYNGSGYSRGALVGEAVNRDDPNNRAEFAANNFTWTALGAGTRNAQGMVLLKRVDGTAANDFPVAWIEFTTPWAGNGSDVTISWDAEGIVQVT